VDQRKLEIIAEPGEATIVTRRVVAAPRALVFDAFTKLGGASVEVAS
jgi:hypothetical protein